MPAQDNGSRQSLLWKMNIMINIFLMVGKIFIISSLFTRLLNVICFTDITMFSVVLTLKLTYISFYFHINIATFVGFQIAEYTYFYIHNPSSPS